MCKAIYKTPGDFPMHLGSGLAWATDKYVSGQCNSN